MRIIRNKSLQATLLSSALLLPLSAAEVLNVYSHRHYEVDQQVNQLFTGKTGIEVKVVNAEADQLIERLKSEGTNSPADVLVTVDAGRMQRAKAEGLLQPLKSGWKRPRPPPCETPTASGIPTPSAPASSWSPATA